MEVLAFLAAPFVASLILTGIHAYLGVHVVERGVIFVDLSLAQIAALGTTVAALYGLEPHGTGSYWLSLGFTFLGAAVFSTIRGQRARIPQEAIIGICYAVASAAAILAMSKAVQETEHLKEMLVGNILIVPSVGAMLYAGRIGPRLAIGWTMGTLVSAVGVYLSLKIDLPTGATIVCTFGLVLILMALARGLVRRALRRPAIMEAWSRSAGS